MVQVEIIICPKRPPTMPPEVLLEAVSCSDGCHSSSYRLDFSGTTSLSTTPDQPHAQRQMLPPRSRTPTHLKLFFISRSLVMIAIGSVSPVAF
jgi:hypothetical protein